MKAQLLDFAGVRLETNETTLYVDAIAEFAEPALDLAPRTESVHALVTHRHTDHYDERLLTELLSGPKSTLIAEIRVVSTLASALPRVREVAFYEPIVIGAHADFVVLAVPASDGFGDPQASWVVDGGGRRVLHLGDTTWHGHWWNIARAYGPFDAVFVPVNGAVLDRPRFQSSGVPLVLDPAQAAAAALALDARLAIPIHYGLNDDPTYIEVEDAERLFAERAAGLGVPVRVLARGEWLEWPDSTTAEARR